MRNITLGTTGITAPQNGFGALPLQRDDMDTAVRILRRALDGGMTFFDTARAYSDSEEKLGKAFSEGGLRNQLFIATKTMAKTPEGFWRDLETSLKTPKTDHVDIYQFHQTTEVYQPGDGTGMYECMLKAKEQGKILHIGVTAHRIGVAEALVDTGLYETLQYPFSYLASDREKALSARCREKNMGLIAMKGLAGGLINRADAAMAFMTEYDNVMPIWGIQRERELEEFLSFMADTPVMDEEKRAFIESERRELSGDFCRGCGYCMPCPKGIQINNCARMSLMLRRAPSSAWLNECWQTEMARIEECVNCRQCSHKCPYELDTPTLLKRNL
ncbi:MAG: aldo/keto reductase, partial [Clostridia bacterium]|nr:aldo/keto reductase [Clostridia bacterium]